MLIKKGNKNLGVFILPDDRQIDVWLFTVGGVGVVLATALENIFVADFLLFATLFNELMGRLSKNPPKQKRKEKNESIESMTKWELALKNRTKGQLTTNNYSLYVIARLQHNIEIS